MSTTAPEAAHYPDDDSIDLADLLRRIGRGLPKILGWAFIGVAIGALAALALARIREPVSTVRVSFGFTGFANGSYPYGSNFQPEDLLAPDLVIEALRDLAIEDRSGVLATQVRGSLTVTGLVSPTIVEERDRLRAAGQSLPPYIPDEYQISLAVTDDMGIGKRQRERLLAELVSAYKDKFQRTYALLPEEFGNTFEQLKNADFANYEIILSRHMQSLRTYLQQKAEQANYFRSPTINMSFQDLLKQADIFAQIHMNEVLGLIYLGGLSKDRAQAIANMDYQLRILADREQLLIEEQAVVNDLLQQTQDRRQNYVVAAKSELAQREQPILDQDFIDALLTNDAYNFLVRRALDAGLAVKRVQAEKAVVLDRRKRLESFAEAEIADQSDIIQRTSAALADLEASYTELLANVRTCLEDFTRQEYANAVRITKQPSTESWLKTLALGIVIGGFIGGSLGLGSSLLIPAPARP